MSELLHRLRQLDAEATPGREVLDLFSAAAGGWSLGMHRAGYRTVAACEVVPWRRAVYAENNPDVRLYDDVRTLTAGRLLADLGRLPSIVVGSPPCQDISSANTKGKGVEGERSGLYFEAIRIIGEVRPRWAALENSANLRTRGADAVLVALEELGYACWPFVVRAGDIGANHERPRCWLLACDVEQVGNAAQDGCGSRLSWGHAGAVAGAGKPTCRDALDPTRVGHAGRRAWGHRPDGDGAPPVAGGDAAHAHRQFSNVGAVQSGSQIEGCDLSGNGAADRDICGTHGTGALPRRLGRVGAVGNPADSDQARQAHGCVVPGLRQAEIADDGRGAGRRADGPGTGQMGLCPPDRGDADRSGPDWSLAHLADHLRLDDGLSARLAGTRVDVGNGKGQSAASLVVEALGDAVIPQIPEAIGRAIIRVEAALSAVHLEIAA